MELKDEFEFKPINEGLGFHKKKPSISLDLDIEDTQHPSKSMNKAHFDQSEAPRHQTPSQNQQRPIESHSALQRQKTEVMSPVITDPNIQFDSEIDQRTFNEAPSLFPYDMESDIFSRTRTTQVPAIDEAMDRPSPEISHPVQPAPLSQHPTSTADTAKQAVNRANAAKADVLPQAAYAPQKSLQLQDASPHLGAYLLDLFVIFGLANIFVMPLILITGIDLSYILTNAQSDPALQISLAILCLAVLNFYLMTSRSFFGATLGEWACDLSLGNDAKKQSPIYPILVALRCVVMTVTGIVTLPFLGLLTQRDLLGRLCFVRLNKASSN